MTGVLFDLDGTLLDTLDDLTGSVNYALARLSYPLRSREEVRRFVGNGAGELMRLAVPEGVDPAEALSIFQQHYRVHCQEMTGPYPGVLKALSDIALDYPVAIVSNKPDPAVKSLCAQYFPGVYAMGESTVCPRKPAPEMLFRAMQAIGADSCIYVGDSEVDILTAGNAGVPCISVLWGFRDKAQLLEAGAENFCTHPDELKSMVNRLIAGGSNGK